MTAAQKVSAFDGRLPTQIESTNAAQLRQIMASQLNLDGDTVINVTSDEGKPQPITLTPALAASFMDLLRLVSDGRGFELIPLDTMLTTQEAADILNVSRPHLIKLLGLGDIEHGFVGRHRRIKASDLFTYKENRDLERGKRLEEIAAFDVENDLL
jgi:excisionase family DNA binding protein